VIRDLTGSGTVAAHADYLVVGGGTVGLFLSVWLAEAGYGVVCLESGGMHQDEDEHPLNDVVHLKSEYKGASHGRFRCIGGTSTRWGGALIPFQAADLASGGWPITIEDLTPFLARIEKEFDLASGSFELAGLSSPTHQARLAKWPPFKKRNVFNLLQERVGNLPNLTVWLNATVTDFEAPNGVLQRVEARGSGLNDRIEVTADRIILAAGAIESTRLMLLLDAQNASVVSEKSPALGRYFSDHLSVVVGEIVSTDKAGLNRHVGFRFENNGTMRNLRFELSDAPDVRAAAPASFAHIGFETDGQGGFDVVRAIFRSLQKRRPPAFSDLFGLLRTAPWLCRALWMRFFRKRLLFPDNARFPVHMVIEQTAIPDNRITLSKERVDEFGKPVAEIAWTVTEDDQTNLSKAVSAFEAMWTKISLSGRNRFVRLGEGMAEAELAKGGGIYHPTGSTRMGRTASDGVVDRNLEVFAIPNLQVVSTSVLPTGGGANPTMMLLLLAARCAEQAAARRA
jgi:choline dehydrogenase-like flavoprotein